ncbi:MAG: hypothetical protein JNK56_25000 [Myxococcales bacterium]|nr:hypothetical protein [Myxococcales bacterium]
MSTPSSAGEDARAAAVKRLVSDLEHNLRDAVQRSMRFKLDGSVASLAIVDHYLEQARSETRAPILALLAASAGAYFGELVRNNLGAQWIGDASDPRHLRLLLTPEFAYFSPADIAFAAILGEDPEPDDPRTPPGLPLDTAIHLRSTTTAIPNPRRTADPEDPPPDPPEEDAVTTAPPPILPTDSEDDDRDDASWIAARLGELSPVPADQFYSLTTRYETLELILQMLASRRAQAGYEPYTYTIDDYLHAFS